MSCTEIVTSTQTPHGTYRVRLEPDHDAGDPRQDHDQLATLVLRVRGRNCPLEGDLIAQIDQAMERGGFPVAERYLRAEHDVALVLPVWGYEHGALSVGAGSRTGQYADPWDSGLAGLVYISAQQVKAEWTDHGVDLTNDDLEAVLRAEVAEYDAWTRGEVYGYVVEHTFDEATQGWREIDACWGHIGYDWALQAASEALAGAVQAGAAEHTRRQADAAADRDEIASLRMAEAGA